MKTIILALCIAFTAASCSKNVSIPKQQVAQQTIISWVDSTLHTGSYFEVKKASETPNLVTGNTGSNQSGLIALNDSSYITVTVGALKSTQLIISENNSIIYENFGYSFQSNFLAKKGFQYKIIFKD